MKSPIRSGHRMGPKSKCIMTIAKKNTTKPSSGHVDAEDLIFTMESAPPAKIPEGLYHVSFLRAEKKTMWNTQKLLMSFVVEELGEWHGVQLFLSCPIPPKNKFSAGSKFLRLWTLANGAKPDRYDRMSTNVFKQKIFVAKVETVTKDWKQQPIPEVAQYSKIDTLLSLAAGAPG